MTISDINLLQEKAKNRNDGVYSFRGMLWVVKNGEFVAFANSFGECYQRSGSFNVRIGEVSRGLARKKKLTEWLKNLK